MASEPLGKISVLLIEDDVYDVEAVYRAFESFQPEIFEVTHVTRFADAADRLQYHSFNVILLDLGLPDSFGLNGIERIKTLAEDLPIVVLTGQDDDAAAVRGIEIGVQEFLFKDDLSPRALVRSIQFAIKRKQYLYGRLEDHCEPELRQRLSKASDCIQRLYDQVESDVTDLRKTKLDETQKILVDRVSKSTQNCVNEIDQIAPPKLFSVAKQKVYRG